MATTEIKVRYRLSLSEKTDFKNKVNRGKYQLIIALIGYHFTSH